MQARRADEGDLARLLAMMETFNRDEGIAWQAATAAPALARLLEDDALGHVGIAEQDAKVVGYFVLTWGYDLEWNGRDAVLTELYVVPEGRQAGLGKELLSAVEAVACEAGARALHLMVRPENAPAVRLYARAGYVSPPRTFLTKELTRSETSPAP